MVSQLRAETFHQPSVSQPSLSRYSEAMATRLPVLLTDGIGPAGEAPAKETASGQWRKDDTTKMARDVEPQVGWLSTDYAAIAGPTQNHIYQGHKPETRALQAGARVDQDNPEVVDVR